MNFLKIIFLLFLLFSFSCNKKEKINTKKKEIKFQDTLNIIYSEKWDKEFFASLVHFQKANDCFLNYIYVQNMDSFLDSLISNKITYEVDLILSLDQTNTNSKIINKLFAPYTNNLNDVDKKFLMDKKNRILPYSFAYLGFIYDETLIDISLNSFGNLSNPVLKDKIIIFDPEYQKIGAEFICWIADCFGYYGSIFFWKGIKENIYSIEKDKFLAFNKFFAEEASIILAYNTTKINNPKYKFFSPWEESYLSLYEAGIYIKTNNMMMAQSFMEFLLSDGIQKNMLTLCNRYSVLEKFNPNLSDIENNSKKNNLNKSNRKEFSWRKDYYFSTWQKTINK